MLVNTTYEISGKWAALQLGKQIADEACAPYPQYDGYHDGWQLFVVTVRVPFKGGDIEAGDVVIGEIESTWHHRALHCYSFRNSLHCQLDHGWTEAK